MPRVQGLLRHLRTGERGRHGGIAQGGGGSAGEGGAPVRSVTDPSSRGVGRGSGWGGGGIFGFRERFWIPCFVPGVADRHKSRGCHPLLPLATNEKMKRRGARTAPGHSQRADMSLASGRAYLDLVRNRPCAACHPVIRASSTSRTQ